MYSEITNQVKMVFGIAIAAIIVIALAVLVVKYKMAAVFAGISYIGFVALYLLVLRYANVVITLEGVVVKVSDKMAYLNHDIDDSIRAGLLGVDDIPYEIVKVLSNTSTL